MYNPWSGDDMIDLAKLVTGLIDYIDIDEEYTFNKEEYNYKDIKDLSKVKVKGRIEKKSDNELYIIANVSLSMLLIDSISLEDIWYPISFEIDEKISEIQENFENILEIVPFLWQNIVLEVPLSYTLVEDYSKYKGDGWKLVSEEDIKNTPFSQLKNLEDRSDK